MLNFFKNMKRNVASLIVVTTLFVSQVAFAGNTTGTGTTGFQGSKYATGTAALVNDIFFWLTAILIPVTAGLMIAYQAWKKKAADGDSAAISESNKAIKRILIAAVIGETASTLVTLITGYYK
ncbi:MAG: hypothetical protein K0Q73_2663 [Paenibacillus sp.]|jgi:hypothetical protein|nr:hypothetical protein [Paenibacillus sp.]